MGGKGPGTAGMVALWGPATTLWWALALPSCRSGPQVPAPPGCRWDLVRVCLIPSSAGFLFSMTEGHRDLGWGIGGEAEGRATGSRAEGKGHQELAHRVGGGGDVTGKGMPGWEHHRHSPQTAAFLLAVHAGSVEKGVPPAPPPLVGLRELAGPEWPSVTRLPSWVHLPL